MSSWRPFWDGFAANNYAAQGSRFILRIPFFYTIIQPPDRANACQTVYTFIECTEQCARTISGKKCRRNHQPIVREATEARHLASPTSRLPVCARAIPNCILQICAKQTRVQTQPSRTPAQIQFFNHHSFRQQCVQLDEHTQQRITKSNDANAFLVSATHAIMRRKNCPKCLPQIQTDKSVTIQ